MRYLSLDWIFTAANIKRDGSRPGHFFLVQVEHVFVNVYGDNFVLVCENTIFTKFPSPSFHNI